MAPPARLGKYLLHELIGQGEVFRAHLDPEVAIKTLLAGEQASEAFLERFF